MKKISTVFSFACLFLFHYSLLSAQVLDNFNYTGAVSSNGWTRHSGTAGQIQAISSASDLNGGLNFPGILGASGNRLALVAGYSEDINKPVTGISKVGYLSFLMKVNNLTGLTTAGDYFLGFGGTAGASVTVLAPRIYIKSLGATGGYQLGIMNTSSGTAVYAPDILQPGATVFVVAKLDASVSPIKAELYINPAPGGSSPSTPSASDATSAAALAAFASVYIRTSGTASSGTGNMEIDEIRAGGSWESVTPASTPSAPLITTLTPGNGSLLVGFDMPSSAGSSAILDYEYSLNDAPFVSSSTTRSPFLITGLSNGLSVAVRLRAINNDGPGAISNPVTATPDAIQGPKPVILSISQTSIAEGSGSSIIVEANVSEPVSADETISVEISGSGITSSDYGLSFSTISIPSGQLSGKVALTISDDNDIECKETATISLAGPSSGLKLGEVSSQTLNIEDNEQNSLVITYTSSLAAGSEASGTAITLTATADRNALNDISIPITVSGTGINASDYTVSSVDFVIPANSKTSSVTLTILNDADLEGGESLRASLNLTGPCLSASGTSFQDIFIFDNDYPVAPAGTGEISLSLSSSYQNGTSGSNSAEISAFDPVSKRLFIVNSVAKKLDIVDMTNPSAITPVNSVDLSAVGGINSVAVRNGVVAVAVEALDLVSPGKVLCYNTAGELQKEVAVGSMPDMITFSPDGTKVLTANEGEPSDNYLTDPEGTVSIIDISGGIAGLDETKVTTVNFNSYDGSLESLRSQGVRIFGLNATVSKDLEPEYITFSSDGLTAYVTLQENNAVAVLDIVNKSFTAIRPLGLKDHSQLKNGLDASDQGGVINISTLPLKGVYMPDAIASYVVNGVTYLVTANEGDARVYPRSGTATFNEEVRVGSGSYVLDPVVFPNSAMLKNNAVLGRLQLTNKTGDLDGDGDFDEIHALGSRSFSVWKVLEGGLEQVFDSGDQFERITAADATYGAIFNASNNDILLKSRSDNKGPEPEGVALGVLDGKTYAFIALERTGGLMVYNVTNPATPVFVQYINNRSTTALTGDLGAEGVFFVPASDSPNGLPLVVVSNEVSSTVSVYSIDIPRTVSLTVSGVTGREEGETTITVTATASGAVVGDKQVGLSVSGSGISEADYLLSSASITIANGQTSGTATLKILNDNSLEGGESLRISTGNYSTGISAGANTFRDIFIFDNDYPTAPVGTAEISLSLSSSYQNGTSGSNSAEISAFDPVSKRLFIVNSVARKLDIVDMSSPSSLVAVSTVDLSAVGGVNSVAVRNGIVAVGIEALDLVSPGKVLFYNTSGELQKEVTVGSMPDMITFSPDGTKVLTANEGEPSDNYLTDPEGTVSIIDISGGIAGLDETKVTTVNFNSYDGSLESLRSQGVRIYGLNATVSKDLEPEYITFSSDGLTAYVTLQENNAVAVLDIVNKSFTAIRPLGLKDHSQLNNGLDASDQGGVINISTLPLKGVYMPDAIASYVVNGVTYLITANEGDSRVYPRSGTATFNEEVRVGSGSYVLDPAVFPNSAMLKNNAVLGRLQLTNKSGDLDGDGDFDEIHALGARSFSVWKVVSGGLEQVFDSGDQFERITAADATYGAIFNASNSDFVLKSRSDNKGPEPEGVALGVLDGKTYAFIALERTGGLMVYNVTNPATPVFVQYINNRSTTALTGDLGAEGVFFVPASESPSGKPLVVVSNEISSSVSIYEVGGVALPSAPSELVAEIGTIEGEVKLTWKDNSTSESGFQILRKSASDTNYNLISTGQPGASTYTDSNLNTGVLYQYQVKAFSDFGSTTSNVSEIKLIKAPAASEATQVALKSFQANWQSSTDASEYLLYVSEDNFLTSLAGYDGLMVSGTSREVSGLKPGTSYKYRLKAKSSSFTSLFSGGISVTTIAETRIIATTTSIDFGDAISNVEQIDKDLVLTNNGNSDLTVSGISLPSGFSWVTVPTFPLTVIPNGSLNLAVRFIPVEVKSYSGTIQVTSNSTSGSGIIAVSGRGISITAIDNSSDEIVVYPNPSDGLFFINYKGDINELSVFGVGGKKHESNLIEKISPDLFRIDLTGFAPGLYLIKMNALQLSSKPIKIIKR